MKIFVAVVGMMMTAAADEADSEGWTGDSADVGTESAEDVATPV